MNILIKFNGCIIECDYGYLFIIKDMYFRVMHVKSEIIKANIKKLKKRRLYFVLPGNITRIVRGTEQFTLGIATYLSNYLDVTVLEPIHKNESFKKIEEIDKKYSKLKLGKIKMEKIKNKIKDFKVL